MGFIRPAQQGSVHHPGAGHVHRAAGHPADDVRRLPDGRRRLLLHRGRGVVVTGKVEAGTIGIVDRVALERAGQATRTLLIGGIEQAHDRKESTEVGETVGLLLRDVAKGEVVAGDVLRAGRRGANRRWHGRGKLSSAERS
jgi:hypothetical protein